MDKLNDLLLLNNYFLDKFKMLKKSDKTIHKVEYYLVSRLHIYI